MAYKRMKIQKQHVRALHSTKKYVEEKKERIKDHKNKIKVKKERQLYGNKIKKEV